jgi:DNA ligase (NAD+)
MGNLFLENQSVAITGILQNLTREQAILKLRQAGGKHVATVNRKTNLLVVGSRPGNGKKAQAQRLGVPTLGEDEFLTLLGAGKTLRIPGF